MRIISGDIGESRAAIESLYSSICSEDYKRWTRAGSAAKERAVIVEHEQAAIEFVQKGGVGYIIKSLMGTGIYQIKGGITGYVVPNVAARCWHAVKLQEPADIYTLGGPVTVLRPAEERFSHLSDLPSIVTNHLNLGSAVLNLAGASALDATLSS